MRIKGDGVLFSKFISVRMCVIIIELEMEGKNASQLLCSYFSQ